MEVGKMKLHREVDAVDHLWQLMKLVVAHSRLSHDKMFLGRP